jgi:hypothetical protein
MSALRSTVALAIATGLAIAGVAVVAVTPASAATISTTTTWSEGSEVTAPFGSAWQLVVKVATKAQHGTVPISSSDGTVDILIDGLPGEYVTATTVYPGGIAYFAQPANEPPLAAGTYSVTAVFTPAAGSEFRSSKTSKAATLTITPLTVVPTVEVVTDAATVAVPTVRTSLSGTYLETNGAPPSGDWTVTATDEDGNEAFSATVAQPTKAAEGEVGPLDIPIDSKLKAGETYTVDTVFVPDELIAPGIQIENTPLTTFSTQPPTVAESLSTPLPVPVWLTIFASLVIIGLAVWLVFLVRRLRAGVESAEPELAAIAAAPTAALAVAPVQPAVAEPSGGSWSIGDSLDDEPRRPE